MHAGVSDLIHRLMQFPSSIEYVFDAMFDGRATQSLRDAGSPEVQVDQACTLAGIRESPGKIDRGQCLALSRTRAGDEERATLRTKIDEPPAQYFVLLRGKPDRIGQKDQARLWAGLKCQYTALRCGWNRDTPRDRLVRIWK